MEPSESSEEEEEGDEDLAKEADNMTDVVYEDEYDKDN